MISVYLQCDDPDELEALIAELNDRGTLGVIEFDSGVRAWFDNAAGLEDLVRRYDGDVRDEPDEDWVRRTEESFPPIPVGERFWLVPPWNSDPAPDGRIRLEINPGLACGTGWHPCTQLCLEALERHVRPGSAVLDVGTGSGILSAAALLLGATFVIACDTDPAAAPIARERIVTGSVYVGSADAVKPAAFDVIVANISAPVIEAIQHDLRRALRPSGAMILSGFQSPPDIHGRLIATTERDGWFCQVFLLP